MCSSYVFSNARMYTHLTRVIEQRVIPTLQPKQLPPPFHVPNPTSSQITTTATAAASTSTTTTATAAAAATTATTAAADDTDSVAVSAGRREG